MSAFTEPKEEPKAGPTYSAKQYADAFHEIMEKKLPSEQMLAVNT